MFESLLHPTTEKRLIGLLAKPSHAVLLTGPRGLGKTLVATEVAAHLLDTSTASLTNHAYYRTIIPVKSVITIEQIRGLTDFFRLAVPGNSRIKRVAVVQDADTMGVEAQNALLKLLEEPPEGSVLLLTSSRVQSLLPTVRSRVQILSAQTPTDEQLQVHFKTQGYDISSINQILLRTSSNIAEATELLRDPAETSGDTVQLVRQALAGNSYERLLMVDVLTKPKEAAMSFVETLLQVAVVSLKAAADRRSSSLDRWQNILQSGYTAQQALERNGNPKLVMTDLLLSL
jgi:hypothetical protein